MSLRPFGISLFAALVLSGGFALGAHATGQLIERGAEGIAASLVSMAAPSPVAKVQEADKPGGEKSAPTTRSQPSPQPAASAIPAAAAEAPLRPAPKPAKAASAAKATAITASTSRSGRAKPAVPPAGAWRRPRLLTARSDAAACDDVYVYIVTTFERPGDSFATLSLDAKKRGRQRRIGQRIGPYEVIAIGYNRSRASSAVWLAKGDRVCQALVQNENPVREKAYKQQLRRERSQARARKAKAKAKAKKRRKARARKRALRKKRNRRR